MTYSTESESERTTITQLLDVLPRSLFHPLDIGVHVRILFKVRPLRVLALAGGQLSFDVRWPALLVRHDPLQERFDLSEAEVLADERAVDRGIGALPVR